MPNPRRPMTPDDDRHGTTRGYAAGCKCSPCRVANAAAARARAAYKRRGCSVGPIPNVGTVRRLRALCALGWTTGHLAAELGVIRSAVNNLMIDRRGGTVRRATHDAVSALYDRLSMRQGPSVLSRTRAARKGWAPPLAWDEDDDLDDPAVQPQPWQRSNTDDDLRARRLLAEGLPDWTLTRAERLGVLATWHGRGRSTNELERITGWNCRRDVLIEQRKVEQRAA